jgi:serine/threonine protein kinase
MYMMVFEKLNGGDLLTNIATHVNFNEMHARAVVNDVADALSFIHNLGICVAFHILVDSFFVFFPPLFLSSRHCLLILLCCIVVGVVCCMCMRACERN